MTYEPNPTHSDLDALRELVESAAGSVGPTAAKRPGKRRTTPRTEPVAVAVSAPIPEPATVLSDKELLLAYLLAEQMRRERARWRAVAWVGLGLVWAVLIVSAINSL